MAKNDRCPLPGGQVAKGIDYCETRLDFASPMACGRDANQTPKVLTLHLTVSPISPAFVDQRLHQVRRESIWRTEILEPASGLDECVLSKWPDPLKSVHRE